MTFPLTKIFSSDRTNANGQINHLFKGDVKEDLDSYDEWAKEEDTRPIEPHTILDMDKEGLIAYARDMYGLKLHRKMSAGNMIKEIYDCCNTSAYTHPEMRTKKKTSTRSVGRPKGSKNKPKQDPLIDNI